MDKNTEKIRQLASEGKIEFSQPEAFARVDMKKPDFTITGVQLASAWGDDGTGFVLTWQTQSAGFGELVFDTNDGTLSCDSETMGKKFVKSVFNYFVDHCDDIPE
jgi:hypothetical protein